MGDRNLFIILFSGIWTLVGVIFLGVGVGLRRGYARREERLRARTSGRVVEVVRRESGDSVGFYPIVSFSCDGREIALESDAGGGRRKYYEGQPVEVLYDPDDPSCFRLEGERGTGFVGGIMLAVGGGCVVIAIIAALVTCFAFR